MAKTSMDYSKIKAKDIVEWLIENTNKEVVSEYKKILLGGEKVGTREAKPKFYKEYKDMIDFTNPPKVKEKKKKKSAREELEELLKNY